LGNSWEGIKRDMGRGKRNSLPFNNGKARIGREGLWYHDRKTEAIRRTKKGMDTYAEYEGEEMLAQSSKDRERATRQVIDLWRKSLIVE